jgi:hypothetical protein
MRQGSSCVSAIATSGFFVEDAFRKSRLDRGAPRQSKPTARRRRPTSFHRLCRRDVHRAIIKGTADRAATEASRSQLDPGRARHLANVFALRRPPTVRPILSISGFPTAATRKRHVSSWKFGRRSRRNSEKLFWPLPISSVQHNNSDRRALFR